MLNQALVYDNCSKLFVDVMTFGDWLRQKIKENHLSNAEVARRAGVSSTYIGNLIRDFSPNTKTGKGRPSEEVVENIVKAVGGDLDEARIAAGYAPMGSPMTRKPKNVREFFEVLDDLGLDVQFDGGLNGLESLDEDDLQDLLDSVKATAIVKARRKNKTE